MLHKKFLPYVAAFSSALLLSFCGKGSENNAALLIGALVEASAVTSPAGTVNAPVFTPPQGIYGTDQSVSMSSFTDASYFCYTVDGSDPSCSSSSCSAGIQYTSPVSITALSGNTASVTLKALACRKGYTDSLVETAAYTIDKTPPAQVSGTSALSAGTSGINVSWSASADDTTSTADIYYEICQSTTTGGCETVYTTSAGDLAYAVTGLTYNTTYYFRIQAVDVFGNKGTMSAEFSATTDKPTQQYAWGTLTDELNGTVLFTGDASYGGGTYNGMKLLFKKCSEGQTYDSVTNGCTGNATNTLKFCSATDSSCDNGTILAGTGTSTLYNSCNGLNGGSGYAGVTTWRVPTKSEFLTIVQCNNLVMTSDSSSGCGTGNFTSPTISSFFPNTPSSYYWTATVASTTSAWYVTFYNGSTGTFTKNFLGLYTRCAATVP